MKLFDSHAFMTNYIEQKIKANRTSYNCDIYVINKDDVVIVLGGSINVENLLVDGAWLWRYRVFNDNTYSLILEH